MYNTFAKGEEEPLIVHILPEDHLKTNERMELSEVNTNTANTPKNMLGENILTGQMAEADREDDDKFPHHHDNTMHVKVSHGHNVYIEIPWSPQIYFTVRGAENFHIYLWIAKDLAWSQDALYPAMVFGIAAMSWCGVLVYHAVEQRCYNEIYMLVPLILWLCANFVWMTGEVLNNDDDVDAPKAAIIMESAIAMILFYYFVLKPLKLLPPDELLNTKYDEAELKPRFPFLFSNWREYEHAHTLCWLGKDLSWNTFNPYWWCICLVPTVLIALDFIYTTLKTKRMMIDCSHYVAQFIWVIGNMVWAMGEVFEISGNDDDQRPYALSDISPAAVRHCRWWSSVILLLAYLPIFLLYCFWLPLTCLGQIKAADIPENAELFNHGRSSNSAPHRSPSSDGADASSNSNSNSYSNRVVGSDLIISAATTATTTSPSTSTAAAAAVSNAESKVDDGSTTTDSTVISTVVSPYHTGATAAIVADQPLTIIEAPASPETVECSTAAMS